MIQIYKKVIKKQEGGILDTIEMFPIGLIQPESILYVYTGGVKYSEELEYCKIILKDKIEDLDEKYYYINKTDIPKLLGDDKDV